MHAKLAAFALAHKGKGIFVVAGREGFNLTLGQALTVTHGQLGLLAHEAGIAHYLPNHARLDYGEPDSEAQALQAKGVISDALARYAFTDDASAQRLVELGLYGLEKIQAVLTSGQAADTPFLDAVVQGGKAALAQHWTGHDWFAKVVDDTVNTPPSKGIDTPMLDKIVQDICSSLPTPVADDLAQWGMDNPNAVMTCVPDSICDEVFGT